MGHRHFTAEQKGTAMGVLDLCAGHYGNAIRLLYGVYGFAPSDRTLRQWRDDAEPPDPSVARDVYLQLGMIRVATVAPELSRIRARLRHELRHGTAQDVKHIGETLARLLLVLDPTAAPGGQRGMQLPAGSQGFVAWGPLPAGSQPAQQPSPAPPAESGVTASAVALLDGGGSPEFDGAGTQ